MDVKTVRTVELPHKFGETVYLRDREEKVPGIIIAFDVLPGGNTVQVRWTDQPFTSGAHFAFELCEEYEPRY